jgi:hypothetical protein
LGGIIYQYGPILVTTDGWNQMKSNENFPENSGFDFVDPEAHNG